MKDKQMKFNYQSEKLKYLKRWERLKREYKEAGMNENEINEMMDYDWKVFKKERIFCLHNQYMNGVEASEENRNGECSMLVLRYPEKLSYEEEFMEGPEYWIDNLDTEWIIETAKGLSDEQQTIIRMIVYEGYRISELAAILGIRYDAALKRYLRIKNKFIKNRK